MWKFSSNNGLTSDSSPRTKSIQRPTIVTICAVILLIVSSLWVGAGLWRYNQVMAASSTPVGTELTFSNSQAKIDLSGLYTDVSENVLIARLTPSPKAHEVLPYRGTDYTVFVKSKALGKNVQEIPVLFGKMGTDGDMFLVLPKPTDDVYQFVIVNNKESSQDILKESQDARSSDSSDASKSVTSALSEFANDQSKSGSNDLGSSAQKTRGGSKYDMTGFRMTLDPAVKEDAYTPEIIKTNLLDESTGQFDFKAFYDRIYVKAAVDSLTKKYNTTNATVSELESQRDDYETRLKMNPSDSAAATTLKEIISRIQVLKTKQQEYADRITYYTSLSYDPAIFQNFQNKAIVIH